MLNKHIQWIVQLKCHLTVAAMKKITSGVLIIIFTTFFCIQIKGQENEKQSESFRPNSINGYFGFVELNINYERNIFYRPKSQTGLRFGIGYGAFATAGEGVYLNPAIVHLLGKKNSFLELDLGFKYIVGYTGLNIDYSQFLLPDFFAGYRYERPDGKRIFRLGINWPTLVNVGIGYKF